MNSVIQEWYKSNKNTKIQELIMRVTNYAWGEMTLFEQGTLREEAAQEFTEMTAELLKLRKIAAVADKMAERFEGSYNKGDEEVLAEYTEAISL